MKLRILLLVSLLATVLSVSAKDLKGGVMESPRQRVIVLTDMENEPDDAESVVRLLMYSNKIDIRGIVATTSTHLRNRVVPETILNDIDAYAKVRDNLMKHESGWPEADALRSVVKSGLPRYGMNGVGKGMDSEGSELIIKELKNNDDRPLWISAWGGINTLAQALYKMRETESKSELNRLVSKLRVYTISDQDDSGLWIRKEFPNLFYIVTPGLYTRSAWVGMSSKDSLSNNEVITNRWLTENIQQGHGPLGACYPDVAYTMEGDTPSFLGLIPNGLNNMEHPDWGGWGGRHELRLPDFNDYSSDKIVNGDVPLVPETRPIWVSAEDKIDILNKDEAGLDAMLHAKHAKGVRETVYRWREDYQNDFAGRMAWCTKSYSEANHAPVAKAGIYRSVAPYGKDNVAATPIENYTVKSGEVFMLDAKGSTDPDGDALSYEWIYYPEAGSYKKPVKCYDATNIWHCRYLAPKVSKTETLHFILRVTDKGTPAMTSYKRVIVVVKP